MDQKKLEEGISFLIVSLKKKESKEYIWNTLLGTGYTEDEILEMVAMVGEGFKKDPTGFLNKMLKDSEQE